MNLVAELIAERLRLIAQLRGVDRALKALRGISPNSKGRIARRGRVGRISAAGRRRIAAAQRKRWARVRKAKKKA